MEADGTHGRIGTDPGMEMGGAWSSTANSTTLVRYHGTRVPHSYELRPNGRNPRARNEPTRSAADRPEEPASPAVGHSSHLIRSLTLLLLHSTPLTGSCLRRQLEFAGLRPDAGGLYRLLHRLEREGHVACEAAAGEGDGSRERRVYHLTACGVEQLQEEAHELKRLWELLLSFCSQYEQSGLNADTAGSGGLPMEEPGADAPGPAHSAQRHANSPEGTPGEEVGVAAGAVGRLPSAGVSKLERATRLEGGGLAHHEELTGRWRIKPVGAPAGASVELHLSNRDAAIVAARERGDTLQEIGTRFGLSRERVRQIVLGSAASNAKQSKIARAERQLAGADVRSEEVLAAFRAGSGPRAIANRLGLSPACVGWLIDSRATPADRAARRLAQQVSAKRTGPRGHSDEDLIDAVQQVVEDVGRVPLSREYSVIARASGLPSLSTLQSRFGGWNAALRAAGLIHLDESRRPYRRRWTEEACVESLRSLAAELGSVPTLRQYERLSTGRSDLPCAATVRNRVGSWSRLVLLLEGDRV